MIRPNSPVESYSDDDLRDTWKWCGTQRVKRGPYRGCVKQTAAKLGDRIIEEARKRGITSSLVSD